MFKKVFVSVIFTVFLTSGSFAGVNFGMIDAIKSQVKELDKKVVQHIKEKSQTKASAGIAKLEEAYSILSQGGSFESFISKIQEANSSFEDALKDDPDNPDANLGYAITSTILIVEDPQVKELIGETTSQATFSIQTMRIMGTSIMPTRSALSIQSFLSPQSMNSFALKAMGNPPAISKVQQVIVDVIIPVIDKVLRVLEKLENLPAFSLTLKVGEQTVEIDKGEVYALDATVQLLKSFLCFFCSYNLDVNYDDFKSTTAKKIAFEKMVKKQDYYANFLTLKNSSLLKTSGDAFGNIGRKTVLGMSSIEAETDDQADDIIKKPGTSSELDGWNKCKKAFQQLYDATLGPTTIKFTDYDSKATLPDLKVNLNAIFYNPQLQDFRVFIPTGTWDFDYLFLTYADTDKDNKVPDFNDPTFYGLFPDITNQNWETHFGSKTVVYSGITERDSSGNLIGTPDSDDWKDIVNIATGVVCYPNPVVVGTQTIIKFSLQQPGWIRLEFERENTLPVKYEDYYFGYELPNDLQYIWTPPQPGLYRCSIIINGYQTYGDILVTK